jgi:endonuclease/exonuclease/phosphatase (EEP) superfamily protein YafD
MNIQSVIVVLILSAQTAFANPSFLCEDNNDSDYARFSGDVVQRQSQIIEVLTWNVLKFKRENSFSDLIYLTAKSDIAFIQESVHSADLQTQFQSEISMDWTFFKSFCRDYGSSGVQTGTRFPQIKVEAVKAPALEPVVNTPKVTGFSTIEIQGHKVLLVNIHGLNANQGLDFERHIHQVYEIIKKFKGPVIWAGDFNTWNPIRTMYLKNKAKDLGMTLLKPEVDNRKMKLDHIIVRGFKVNSVFILETYESSDHWPVRAELEFSP